MRTKRLLLILFLGILLQSCLKYDPCGESPQKSYYIPIKKEALALTPYFLNSAFDTISYTSDKDDTLIFVKTKTDTFWLEEKGSGDPDCGFDRHFPQIIKNSYTTIKGDGYFYVNHCKRQYHINTILSDVLQFFLKGGYFVIHQDQINSPIHFSNFIGDYKINNKIYSNSFYCYSGDTNSFKLIMNKDFGVISFMDSTQKWTITK